MSLTKDQWYAHPSFRRELAEILAHPTFQAALLIVEKSGLKPTPITPGIDLVDFFALMGAKRDGYFEGLKNLEDLAKPQPTPPPAPAPWTGVKPPRPDDDRTSAP